MRHFTTILIALGFLCVAGIAANQVQEKAAPPGVAELIDKLGSPKFAEREQAMKELESLGSATLPLLRTALKSNDAEIRRRAEKLVRKIEDQELTTKLLVGKRVRLILKDAFISEAEAELTKLGYPVFRPGHLGARNDIKITLDTGDTTFWEALLQLGTKITAADPKIGQPDKTLAPVEVESPFLDYTYIPLGRLVTNPVCFAGSVRIMLIKAQTLPSGEVDFTLEVANEPLLFDFAMAGNARIDKAIDDLGRALPVHLSPSPKPLNAVGEAHGIYGGAPGIGNPGNVKPLLLNGRNLATSSFMYPTPDAMFKSIQIPIRLKTGPIPAKVLSEVSGKIAVSTTIETEPILVMDNVLKAAGQTTKGKKGDTLTLLEIEKSKTGEITIKVVMENPIPKPAIAAGGVNNMRAALLPIPRKDADLGGVSPLRLLDTAGKEFTQEGITSAIASISPTGRIQKETIVFSPKPGQDEAACLVLPGYRSFSFEVPFTFKNIPLTKD